jgi:hypothetical protein
MQEVVLYQIVAAQCHPRAEGNLQEVELCAYNYPDQFSHHVRYAMWDSKSMAENRFRLNISHLRIGSHMGGGLQFDGAKRMGGFAPRFISLLRSLLEVKHLVQFLIRHIKDHIMRGQRLFFEKIRQSVVRGGETGSFVEFQFRLEYLLAVFQHVIEGHI